MSDVLAWQGSGRRRPSVFPGPLGPMALRARTHAQHPALRSVLFHG